MQKVSRNKTDGFTIFEVTMAAAVMALAIMSTLVAMGRAFAPLDSARCISYASQIMQSEMEKMRLTTWGDGTTAGTGTTGITAYATSATNLPIDTTFTTAADLGSRMTLTRTASDVHAGMIKVTLTITWTTADRRTLTRSYITYYGKNGLYDFFVA
jgi:Tfp pilus assembly protein PilV